MNSNIRWAGRLLPVVVAVLLQTQSGHAGSTPPSANVKTAGSESRSEALSFEQTQQALRGESGSRRFVKIRALLDSMPAELTADQVLALVGSSAYQLRAIELFKDRLPQPLRYDAVLKLVAPMAGSSRYRAIEMLADRMPATLTGDQVMALVDSSAYQLRAIELLKDRLPQPLSYDAVLKLVAPMSGSSRYKAIEMFADRMPATLTGDQVLALVDSSAYQLRAIELLKDRLPQPLSYDAVLKLVAPMAGSGRYKTIEMFADRMPATLTGDQVLALVDSSAYQLRAIELLKDRLPQPLSYDAVLKLVAPMSGSSRYKAIEMFADRMPARLTDEQVTALVESSAARARAIELLSRNSTQAMPPAPGRDKTPTPELAAAQVERAPATGKSAGPSPSTGISKPPAVRATPLSAPMRRLVGTWIAHTRCQVDKYGTNSMQQILLSVHADAAKPSGVAAEARGLQDDRRPTGVALDVTFDNASRQYHFGFAGRLPDTRELQTPYGLVLAFLKDRALLHGKVTGHHNCEAVVAGRLPRDEAPPNPDGLLYKFTASRSIEPLTESECSRYARWLADAKTVVAGGYTHQLAVADAATMRQVLGHDLAQWTDADSRKIVLIHRGCHTLLKASNNPKAIQLAAQEKVWGHIAEPLRYTKSKNRARWRESYFALNRALYADVLKTWWLIEDGLLARQPKPVVPQPGDKAGLAGEWRGYYHCDGGNDVFMRLTFVSGDPPSEVRFDFGPSLKSFYPSGAMSMTGMFDAATGRVALNPQHWIEQTRAATGVPPIGFEGHLSRNANVIKGKVKGQPNCSGFSVTKRTIASKPPNPDGLLFHYLAKDMVTATVADCRDYAEWLAAGDEIRLGGVYFFSRLRSANAMRAAYGKDLYQWTDDDARKLRTLSRHCNALLKAQVDPEISELLARIEKKGLVWAPDPLTTPREGNGASHWLRAEQLVMINEQQQALAARKLAEARSLPPGADSIDRIDALAAEANSRVRSPFAYLSKQERDNYYDDLQAARTGAAVATAEAAAQAWHQRPQTYAALEKLESAYQRLRDELESRKAPQGVAVLQAAFIAESDKRADKLWPVVLRTTRDELNALAEADLLRFGELGDSQRRQSYLKRFHSPGKEASYFASYQSVRTRYRDTIERMVERSRPQLLAWIDDLPPSKATNDLLDRFSREVFGVTPIPERYPKLLKAASAKTHAYNPDAYLRPDIMMSLKRRQWDEVGLVGLEDLAYMTTSLRMIKNACPAVVPEGSGALMRFAGDLSQQAVSRIMQGQVRNSQEAQRALLVFMNNLVNNPGCRVDYLGNVVGCVTAEAHDAAQELLMTSSEAQRDTDTLLQSGCGHDGAAGYVQGLIAYANVDRNARPAPEARDFWEWTAQRSLGAGAH